MPNYYDDAPPADDAPPMPPEEKPMDDTQTAVIPKEFFGGKELKPGVECKIRIDRVMDKDVAVSYVPHEGEEESEPEEGGDEEAPPAPPEGGGGYGAGAQPGMFD